MRKCLRTFGLFGEPTKATFYAFFRNHDLSKLVSDLVEELQTLDEVDDEFKCFVLSIKIDDEGEITSTESTEPLVSLKADNENQECLFYFEATGKALTVAKVKQELSAIDTDYFICSAEEKTIDDSFVRIDSPIIGFGENIDLKKFFLVCEVY